MNDKLQKIAAEAEEALAPYYAALDRTAMKNYIRVQAAFAEFRVSERHFQASTGYGYNDGGRDALDLVWARVFGAEAALVRHSVISGTHALAVGLFALLRPGDTMLSVSGKPYDTLEKVIGSPGADGTLLGSGVKYEEITLKPGGGLDFGAISEKLAREPSIKVVYVQRSRGYSLRPALSCAEIGELTALVKAARPSVYVAVDNCYGEFTETSEPSAIGADLVIGSLIKNPGGGMAESGAYFCGSEEAVARVADRLTFPGAGAHAGASLGQNKNIFKGLFFAPHTVACALKTALFAAFLFERLGFKVYPRYDEPRYDIIQAVELGSPKLLLAFCRGVQEGSPIDAHVSPEPWDMPGYSDKIVMAAGTFVQGATSEVSADAPMRPPYAAYLQGGLTVESGKLAVLKAAEKIIDVMKM